MTKVSDLTKPQQQRLLKLAREAGRTPQFMLQFVLRDGFDYSEYIVKSVNEGLKSALNSALPFTLHRNN